MDRGMVSEKNLAFMGASGAGHLKVRATPIETGKRFNPVLRSDYALHRKERPLFSAVLPDGRKKRMPFSTGV
jgi:hypothetical protein